MTPQEMYAALTTSAATLPDPDILTPAAVERVMARFRTPEALAAKAAEEARRKAAKESPEALAAKAAAEGEREAVRAEARRREAARAAASAAAIAEAPASVKRGASVRGVFYRGPKHDWSKEPRYLKMPAVVSLAFKKKDTKLSPADLAFATVIYQHLQRAKRAKGANAGRLTFAELGGKLNASADTAARSVARLLAEDVITMPSPGGRGKRAGALYAFAPR